MNGSQEGHQSAFRRWIGLVRRFEVRYRRRRSEPKLFVAAFLLFCVAFLIAYRSLPEIDVAWRWLGLTAIMVPAAITLSGLEYLISARLVGYRVRLGEALRISILASAANLLPLPGAVLVRTQALKYKGAAYGSAFGSTAAIGAGWVGTAMILAGALLLLAGDSWQLGVLLLCGGVGSTLAMLALIRLNRPSVWGPALAIVSTEALFVLVSAVRMYGTLHGIGIEAGGVQALTLTVAAAVASAAGIFPGGLGLRELIAGGLSPLIGLPAAAGVLGAAIDRLIGIGVLGLSALVVILGRRGDRPSREVPDSSENGMSAPRSSMGQRRD